MHRVASSYSKTQQTRTCFPKKQTDWVLIKLVLMIFLGVGVLSQGHWIEKRETDLWVA